MTPTDLRETLAELLQAHDDEIAYLTALGGGALVATLPSRAAGVFGKGHRGRLAKLRRRQKLNAGESVTLHPSDRLRRVANALEREALEGKIKSARNESAFKSGIEMGLGGGLGILGLEVSRQKSGGPVDYDSTRG